MDATLRLGVLIPAYNHASTLGQVVCGAKAHLPVLVVDDGSTDGTAEVLRGEREIHVVTLPVNRGKGAALQAGFARAEELGFTHVISIDADGQHPTSALRIFAEACRRRPDALIVGVRNLKEARAPWLRRISNALSALAFRWETGVRLPDTQCGYRAYPLAMLRCLSATAGGYGFELEVLVRAAWSGVRLVPLVVAVDYAAPTSRLSHFRPVRDWVRMAGLHARLALESLYRRGLRPASTHASDGE